MDAAPDETQIKTRELTPAEALLDPVRDALVTGNISTLRQELSQLHPADFADLVEYLDASDRKALVHQQNALFTPDVLTEMNTGVRESVINWLPDLAVSAALKALEADDAVDLAEELSDAELARYLSGVEASERASIEQSLAYPEYSAGRLMSRDFVVAPQNWTVGETLDFLRAEENDSLPREFYQLYLIDPAYRPIATVSLSRVMREARAVKLADLVQGEALRSFSPTYDQEELAFKFRQYHLVEAPIVEEETGRIVGVVTVDDVLEVIDEEAEDDLLKLVGLQGGESDVQVRWWATARSRFVWLFVNLATVVIAAAVIAQFSDVIEMDGRLAVLLPIVASMGGNAGTQTLAVAVRGLATKDLSLKNATPFVRKELFVGFINGLGFAFIAAMAVILIYGEPMLGLVIAISMVLNMLIAPLSGALIPIALERNGIDPANASAVFLTTITDVVGFFAFLGLASIIFL